MVSLQLSLSMKENNPFRSNQKRKREEEKGENEEEVKAIKSPKLNSFIELNLDTPLPLEWQRFLDIKSGEIYFYNTMTKARTFKDPRCSREKQRVCSNLDLELNLMRKSPEIHGFEADQSGDEKEMMAIVCARCYMLVMMSKSTPLCPNCKFAPPQGVLNRID